eukprot:246854-Amphidinium_carterae.2
MREIGLHPQLFKQVPRHAGHRWYRRARWSLANGCTGGHPGLNAYIGNYLGLGPTTILHNTLLGLGRRYRGRDGTSSPRASMLTAQC